MATDSSSGTLPSSRRLTIDSSSSIARSKGIFLTSTLFSAISLSVRRLLVVRCDEDSPDSLSVHQGGNVRRDRSRKPLQIIATFEERYDTAFGARVGHVHQFLGDPGVVGFYEIEIGERIARVRIEASRNDQDIRLEFTQARENDGLKRFLESTAAITG